MLLPKTNTPSWIILIIDIGISILSLMLAYLLRFDILDNTDQIGKEIEIVTKSIPVFILIKFSVFYSFKIHKGIIRHTSTEDLKRIFYAISVSSFIFLLIGQIRFHFVDNYYLFPNTILVLEFLISFFLILASRFTVKLMYL